MPFNVTLPTGVRLERVEHTVQGACGFPAVVGCVLSLVESDWTRGFQVR